MRFFAALLLLPALAAAPAAADDAGERLFAPCRACHSLDPAVQGLPGPNLSDLIGRRIGGDPAFDYSPVLRKARDEGLRWDAARLDSFLADPADGSWKAWKLPGDNPRTYSVYVDDKDMVWLTDFSANAIVRFDPASEKFNAFPSDKPGANVRQMAGRPGEAWGGESGTNRLVVIQSLAPA